MTDVTAGARARAVWDEIVGWLRPILPEDIFQEGTDDWADFETCKEPCIQVIAAALSAPVGEPTVTREEIVAEVSQAFHETRYSSLHLKRIEAIADRVLALFRQEAAR